MKLNKNVTTEATNPIKISSIISETSKFKMKQKRAKLMKFSDLTKIEQTLGNDEDIITIAENRNRNKIPIKVKKFYVNGFKIAFLADLKAISL